MNGGYFMVDCGGLNLKAESAVTISGMYSRLLDAIKAQKPVFAYNVVFGSNNPMTPIPVMVNTETTSANADIFATASTLQIVVSYQDSVEVRNMIGG